jgi:hypothetical protein
MRPVERDGNRTPGGRPSRSSVEASPSAAKKSCRSYSPWGSCTPASSPFALSIPRRSSEFSHTYPQNPAPVERAKVTGPPPLPKHGAVMRRGHISSMDRLAHVLPRGTIRRVGNSTWLLAKPIADSGKASVTLRGPATLEISPGAYSSPRTAGRWFCVD